MDSFKFDNVKAEKDKAMRRYNRFRNVANIMRVIELCVALYLLSWLFSYFPFTVKFSGEALREFFLSLFTTRAVFVIGNLIVITLFAQSGQFPGQTSDENKSVEDIYDEYVRNREIQPRIVPIHPSPEPEEITIEDKQMIISPANKISPVHEKQICLIDKSEMKPNRRTQSENLQRTLVKSRNVLRRSETEKYRQISKDMSEKLERISCAVDNLSNEAFQRRIEAFIVKQQRSLKEESMAMVVADQ